jgi:hypothetical protein
MLKQVSQAHVMSAPYRPAPHGMRLFGSALYILRWLALASYNVRQPLSPDNRSFEAFAETPRILDRCCQSTLFARGKSCQVLFHPMLIASPQFPTMIANVWAERYTAFLNLESGSVYELDSGPKSSRFSMEEAQPGLN